MGFRGTSLDTGSTERPRYRVGEYPRNGCDTPKDLTVLPLTSLEGKRRRVYGFEVLLPAGAAGNSVDSIVMPQQIHTLAQSQVTRIMGSLQRPDIQADIEERLLEHLGVGFDDDLSP
jgi:mRNA-degrading endonuclease toxin of MazEF toxin-antitoxin module